MSGLTVYKDCKHDQQGWKSINALKMLDNVKHFVYKILNYTNVTINCLCFEALDIDLLDNLLYSLEYN